MSNKKYIDPKTIKDVFWLQTAFIGDIILNSGAIELLKDSFPHINQHIITTKQGAEIYENDPRIKSIIIFEKRKNAFKNFLRARSRVLSIALKNSSLLLQPHRSFRSTIFSKLAGIKTVTYYETSAGFLADYRFKRILELHESSRIALLLKIFNIDENKIIDTKPILTSLPLKDNALINFFKTPTIAIAPGSVWGTKRWPKEKFGELLKKLYDYYPNNNFILIGSQAEYNTCMIINNYIDDKEKRILNFAGKTSIKDLRRIFPLLSLLISNDSSPVHFASSFNIPTVAIFGPTIPAMGFGPLSSKSKVAQLDSLSCRPCHAHGPDKCPLIHFKCMKDLSVNMVFKCIKDLSFNNNF